MSGLFPSGIEAVATPGKASAGDKQPSAAGEKEELTKDEILQKNREEFFKRHMKAGEKSRSVTRTRSVYFKPAFPGVPQPWPSLSFGDTRILPFLDIIPFSLLHCSPGRLGEGVLGEGK